MRKIAPKLTCCDLSLGLCGSGVSFLLASFARCSDASLVLV